jgi:hypothetical protein
MMMIVMAMSSGVKSKWRCVRRMRDVDVDYCDV